MGTLRKFEVAGSAAAMGAAFGEHFRQQVRALTESRIVHLLEFVARYGPARELSRQDVLALARQTVEVHRRYCPPIWEEFSAIARAANLSVEELLIGNGYTDFRDYSLVAAGAAGATGAADRPVPGECSAFAVPAALAAGGLPIVGQTWDMNADARPFLVLLRRRPDDGPETLCLTTTGCLCLIGMNSEGLAVGNTNLVASDARVGVNYLFTVTRALQCRSAAEAAEAIAATPRLSGHDFYAADGREVINIEASATRCCRTTVADQVLVHTNHFLCDSLAGFELSRGLANSQWRYRRLSANFAALRPPFSLEDCWRQLADNTRGDGAICNEDYEGTYGPAATLATVVQCPARREIHVCEGGARLGTREVLRM